MSSDYHTKELKPQVKRDEAPANGVLCRRCAERWATTWLWRGGVRAAVCNPCAVKDHGK